MNDDFNMEDELANSIAQIIDEETSEAEDMYRDKLTVKPIRLNLWMKMTMIMTMTIITITSASCL